MRWLILIALLLPLPAKAVALDRPFGGLRLLDGYQYKRSNTVDTINGVIYREGGLSIEFESGISEGYAADPKERAKYIWYREQVVGGHKVMLALTRPGMGAAWKPEKPRGSPPGNILIVTFPGSFGPLDAANFYAEVLNEQEVADTLLMVLTFDPTK